MTTAAKSCDSICVTPWGEVVMMGYSRHIGRVGALAVAMGVGFGIAGAPGVASADTGSEATAPSAADAKTSEAPSTSLAAAVSSAVHDMLSGIQRAAGIAKTGTTGADSSSTADPRDGIVQTS